MDWNAVAGVEPPVDEDAVEAELVAYVAGAVEPVREPWSITTPGQADWAMRRLADAREQERGMRDEVTLWQAAAARLSTAGNWFEDRLKEWALAHRTKERKTFPLAHGSIGTTERKAAIEVVDEDAAIEWAKNTPITVVCPECNGAQPDDEGKVYCARCDNDGTVSVPLASLGAVKVSEDFRISAAKDYVRIGELVVGWLAIDKSSGEQQRIVLDVYRPFVQAELDQVQTTLGDGYVVQAETLDAVVDAAGVPVPGLGVKPGSVTASVRPLGV